MGRQVLRNFYRQVVILPIIFLVTIIISLSVLNNDKSYKVNILIWKTTEISLGNWILLSYSSGTVLMTTLIYLLTNDSFSMKRRVVYESKNRIEETDNFDFRENNSSKSTETNELNNLDGNDIRQRDINDPAPTIAIPYRIVKKGNKNTEANEIKEKFYTKGVTDIYSNKNESETVPNDHDWENDDEDW